MIQTLNEYLPNYNSVNETIASDTLKSAQQSKGPPPKPSASNAEVEQTMRLLQTLSPQQRDLLKQALAADTNDAWKKGVDYSECNRVSLKAYPKANKSSMSDATTKKGSAGMGGKELSELLSKEFSPEFAEKAAELFNQRADEGALRRIAEMVSDNPQFSLLLHPEQDVVEIYLDYISQLESEIHEIQVGESTMAGALMAENQRLNEDQIYSERQQKPIKSLDMDDEIDPDNIVLMECDDQHIGDPKMRAQSRFLAQDISQCKSCRSK